MDERDITVAPADVGGTGFRKRFTRIIMRFQIAGVEIEESRNFLGCGQNPTAPMWDVIHGVYDDRKAELANMESAKAKRRVD